MEDIVYLFRVLVDGEMWKDDGLMLRVPWRKEEFSAATSKKLRVGYYLDDGFVEAAPACQRAVLEAVAALEAAGCEVVPFPLPNAIEVMSTFYGLLSADDGWTVQASLKSDPPTPHVAGLLNLLIMPPIVRSLVAAYIALKDPVMAMTMRSMKRLTVTDYYAECHRRNECRHRWAEAMTAVNVDVVLAPGLGLPAPKSM